MKKILLYTFMAVMALTMQSCLHDNDEVFDKSAAERIDAAIAKAEQVLLSSQNGWVLHYYAGQEYAYGGLNLAMKFKDGKVTMYQDGAVDDNDNYITLTSTYKFTRDQGPVLAFDTYNDFLHSWGDPMGNNAPTDVDGWEADYEFVVMNISEDQNTITLKGKKFGNKMILERLNVTPEEYFDEANIVADAFEYYSKLNYKKDGKKARFINDGSQFTIQYLDEENNILEMEVPYTYTNKGVLFNLPIELYGQTISGINVDITVTEEKPVVNGFQLKDDEKQVLTEPNDPNEIFTSYNWYVAASNLGTVAKAGFDKFVESCATKEGEQVGYMYLGTYTYRKVDYYGLAFKSGKYTGCAAIKVDADFADGNKITFIFDSNISDAAYYTTNDFFGEAVAPYINTFTIQYDNDANPTEVTLTDVNNPENVIKLTTEKITNPADK